MTALRAILSGPETISGENREGDRSSHLALDAANIEGTFFERGHGKRLGELHKLHSEGAEPSPAPIWRDTKRARIGAGALPILMSRHLPAPVYFCPCRGIRRSGATWVVKHPALDRVRTKASAVAEAGQKRTSRQQETAGRRKVNPVAYDPVYQGPKILSHDRA